MKQLPFKTGPLKRATTENELLMDECESKVFKRNLNLPPRISMANLPLNTSSLPPLSRSAIKQQLCILKDSSAKDYSFQLNALISRITPSKLGCFTERLEETEKLPKLTLTDKCKKDKTTFFGCDSKGVESKKNSFISKAGFKTADLGKSKKPKNSFVAVKPKVKNVNGNFFFAVGEGHGHHGYLISDSLKLNIIQVLDTLYPESEDPNLIHAILPKLNTTLLSMLENQSQELNFSACSLCTIFITGPKLFISNIGTCGAVIVRHLNSFTSQELIPRHNLDNKAERARIKKIEKSVPDIQLNGKKVKIGKKGPNFEQTRALGYYVGNPYLSNKSENKEYELKAEDKFVILGSSSVWEILGYQEAVDLCVEGYLAKKTEMCCNSIVEECKKRLSWNQKSVNDLSVLVFFINESNW